MIGAILAGGDSRRMGEPKALLAIDGTPLAGRVGAALTGGGGRPVWLVGGDPSWADALGFAPVPDRWPGQGPLGGLASTLTASAGAGLEPGAVVVVAACDHVALTPDLVRRLAAALGAAPPEVVAVAPVDPDGRRHPFPSAWRIGAGRDLAALVESGRRRADAAFTVGPVLALPVTTEALVDLDTPDDLRRWELRDRAGPERQPPGP